MGKIKSSAFWWFMHHLQQEEHKRTGRVPSMGQLNGRAGELWKKMSAEERQPFIDKHERYKSGARPPLTDFSVTVKQRKEPKKEITIKEDPDASSSRPESSTTTSTANGASEDQNRKAKITDALGKFINEIDIEKLMKIKFYTIASNVMCGTRKEMIADGYVTEDTYYPLEIGIVEFTMADGIIYEFNEFVDPGPIPENMARICHEHAKKHEIPLSDFGLFKGCCKDPLTQEYIPEERREDFDRVICDIHDLIVKSIIDEIQDTPEKPVKLLFCQGDQIFQNIGVLKTLGKEAGYDNFTESIEILDVTELFFFLCQRKGFEERDPLTDILECNKFNYYGRCEYHTTTETAYCAITVAKKFCWLMFEKLSELYDFKLKEKHIPKEEKKKEIKTDDDWLTWETELPPRPSAKRRYFTEDFDEPRRPTKVPATVLWPETLGRGKSRRDVHSINRSTSGPSTPVFGSTDIRERNKSIKDETEPESKPGPSGFNCKPRLPGSGPVEVTPFLSYQPRGDSNGEDTKAKVAPAPTPDTSRPFGRGRGRDTRPSI